MRSLRLIVMTIIMFMAIVIPTHASTSVVTLYKSPQKVTSHGNETDTYHEIIQNDGYLRVKIESSSDVQFELHVTQEQIDSDYGDVYTRSTWDRKSDDSFIWEGHVPVVEGDVDVSIFMGSLTSYVVTIQWAEFENGNGYVLSSKSVKMLPRETYTLSIKRDVGDDKYSGGIAFSTSNSNVIKVRKTKKSRIQIKALSVGTSTIKVVLDNKQVLSCKVHVTDNIYRCKEAKDIEYNDEWSCSAYVSKAQFTSKGNLKLTVVLNNQWMNSAFGWKGHIVGLTESNDCFMNVAINKDFRVGYGTTKFSVTVPKKYIKMRNVKLTKSTFTSIGRVIAY